MRHPLRIVPAAVLSLFLLTGCAWLQEPLDPAISAAVSDARQLRVEVASEIQTLQDAISGLEEQDGLTPDEGFLLDKLYDTLENLQTSIASVDSWLEMAEGIVEGSPTNEDAVMNSAITLGKVFGVPFVGLGAGLWWKWREANRLRTAVVNMEDHRTSTGGVNWPGLKEANRKTKGVNTLLRKIRDGS